MNLPQKTYPITQPTPLGSDEHRAFSNLQVRVCRRFFFDSAHQLFDYIGKCSRLHGHNYELEVEVSGIRQPNGIVIDFGDLKDIVNANVVKLLDHQNLCDFLKINTTAENLAVTIFRVLDLRFSEVTFVPTHTLMRVRVQETSGCWAEVRREDYENVS